VAVVKVLELMNEIQWRYPEQERWSILRRLLEQQQAMEEAAQQRNGADSDSGRWDCPKCDVTFIRRHYTECPKCGTPRPKPR
jgi:rubrerythrin